MPSWSCFVHRSRGWSPRSLLHFKNFFNVFIFCKYHSSKMHIIKTELVAMALITFWWNFGPKFTKQKSYFTMALIKVLPLIPFLRYIISSKVCNDGSWNIYLRGPRYSPKILPYWFFSWLIPQNKLGLLSFGGIMNFALPSNGYLRGPGGKFIGLDVKKDHHYHQEVKYHL